LAILGALLAAGSVGLISEGPLDLAVPEFVGWFLALFVVYSAAVWAVLRPCGGESGRGRWTWALIWVVAVVCRLVLFQAEPRLSEDLNRYRWQGMLQAAGGNPYLAKPEDPEWAGLRDSTWEQVNRKDFRSAYGPLLELTYHGWYRVVSAAGVEESRQPGWFRIPFAAADLGVGLALAGLLSALGLARERVLIYLWNPLVMVEFWVQGHNDSLLLVLFVLALWAAQAGRWKGAFAALAGAVMTKFWPVIAVPYLLRERGWRRIPWGGVAAGCGLAAAVSLPYWGALGNVTEVLEGFVGGWRNNDSLYGLLWSWAGEDYERGTEIAGRLMVVGLAAVWFLRPGRIAGLLSSVVVILLLAANVFPWYLTWLAPLLAIYPRPALLLWTGLAVLHYRILPEYTLLGVWRDADWVRALEYGPVLAWLAWDGAVWVWNRIKTANSDVVSENVPLR